MVTVVVRRTVVRRTTAVTDDERGTAVAAVPLSSAGRGCSSCPATTNHDDDYEQDNSDNSDNSRDYDAGTGSGRIDPQRHHEGIVAFPKNH